MTKKEQILTNTITYFNENGYGEVSLQELSKALNMSRGNFVYHFKTKEEVLEAIAEKMWSEMEEIRIPTKELPSFQNVHNEVELFQKIQLKYTFVFSDLRIIRDAIFKERFHQSYLNFKKMSAEAIAFSIQLGNMAEEAYPGMYDHLTDAIWGMAWFQHSMKAIQQKNNSTDASKLMWSLLLPHFTKKGVESFISFYGASYLQHLGKPFDIKLTKPKFI